MAEQNSADSDFAATLGQMRTLASTLEAIHGVHAVEVAKFFAEAHGQEGDRGRLRAWTMVAGLIQQREYERLD